jgi:hypothetical protein
MIRARWLDVHSVQFRARRSQWNLARGLATSGCGIGKRTKLQMGYEEVAGLAPKDKRVIIRKIDKNT